MPPKIPPTTSLVCVGTPLLLEDPEDADVEVEEEVPAEAVEAPDPSPPPRLYVAEADSAADDHPVDDESERLLHAEEELEAWAEVELIVELANVVEASELGTVELEVVFNEEIGVDSDGDDDRREEEEANELEVELRVEKDDDDSGDDDDDMCVKDNAAGIDVVAAEEDRPVSEEEDPVTVSDDEVAVAESASEEGLCRESRTGAIDDLDDADGLHDLGDGGIPGIQDCCCCCGGGVGPAIVELLMRMSVGVAVSLAVVLTGLKE
ncbi:hypothetical protein M406DRAFT_326360 [Cryphonectria parasitica EP155]|uniref:Uncharacterized protein n=1 Tax=Cryphonectria parasitica (strain ATCC 38755 / EP155) TaxID=660469 RepID=A0A9P4YCD7_CRYP1|nr:uncharacterized protein M406DRAFT_326360 [Cryphonectria parasitica EP155]KAF3770949.1 hypothetical protein M406DRAFT_326360 [Cryphonectria parasitica EP155]